MRRLAAALLVLVLGLFLQGSGCKPTGCSSSISGDSNTVQQACGGDGEEATGTITPAPVVVPPVQIVPVINNPPAS